MVPHVTKRFGAVVVYVLALTPIQSVDAQQEANHAWRVATAGGVDTRVSHHATGHGFFLVDAVGKRAMGGADLQLQFNTDTLEVGVQRIRVAERLSLSTALRGEAFLAGLLQDYFQRGVRLPEFGFNASYVESRTQLYWRPKNRHSIMAQLQLRKWWLFRAESTSNTLALPEDPIVVQPMLGYTYWNVKAGSKEWQAHRLFPRWNGFAFGMSARTDIRTHATSWGAPGDIRNQPAQVGGSVDQWMRAGTAWTSGTRVQFTQQGVWGWGQDDLTRVRIGGMNPYVVAIPGLPWAALLSERLLAGETSFHMALGRHEIGLLVAAGMFNDIQREGDLHTFGFAGGAGPLFDLRVGRWQVHLRGGVAWPSGWLEKAAQVSAMATVGAQL